MRVASTHGVGDYGFGRIRFDRTLSLRWDGSCPLFIRSAARISVAEILPWFSTPHFLRGQRMRRVKSQSRKKSSRTRNASRDEAWRQFLDSNRFHVELEPEAHGVYEPSMSPRRTRWRTRSARSSVRLPGARRSGRSRVRWVPRSSCSFSTDFSLGLDRPPARRGAVVRAVHQFASWVSRNDF